MSNSQESGGGLWKREFRKKKKELGSQKTTEEAFIKEGFHAGRTEDGWLPQRVGFKGLA